MTHDNDSRSVEFTGNVVDFLALKGRLVTESRHESMLKLRDKIARINDGLDSGSVDCDHKAFDM